MVAKVLFGISAMLIISGVGCICKAVDYIKVKELYKKNVMNTIGIICCLIGLSLFGLIITECI